MEMLPERLHNAFWFPSDGERFSILFLSSLVTVMYSLESYEGPDLHLFKEFRDWEFRDGRRKSERKMLEISIFWQKIMT